MQWFEKNRVVVGKRFGHAARRAEVELATVVIKRGHGRRCGDRHSLDRAMFEIGYECGARLRRRRKEEVLVLQDVSDFCLAGKCRVGFRIAVGRHACAKAGGPWPGSTDEISLRDDTRAKTDRGDQGKDRNHEKDGPDRARSVAFLLLLSLVR